MVSLVFRITLLLSLHSSSTVIIYFKLPQLCEHKYTYGNGLSLCRVAVLSQLSNHGTRRLGAIFII